MPPKGPLRLAVLMEGSYPQQHRLLTQDSIHKKNPNNVRHVAGISRLIYISPYRNAVRYSTLHVYGYAKRIIYLIIR